MMEERLLTLINNQTSNYSFTDEEISDENLMKIAQAGRNSPTELYNEKRKFTVVQNKDLIYKLLKAMGDEMNINHRLFCNPSALLLVSVPENNPYSIFEVGLTSQNIMMTASELGIASVWTGQIHHFSDRPKVREIFEELNIPDDHFLLNMMVLGIISQTSEIEETQKENYSI